MWFSDSDFAWIYNECLLELLPIVFSLFMESHGVCLLFSYLFAKELLCLKYLVCYEFKCSLWSLPGMREIAILEDIIINYTLLLLCSANIIHFYTNRIFWWKGTGLNRNKISLKSHTVQKNGTRIALKLISLILDLVFIYLYIL